MIYRISKRDWLHWGTRWGHFGFDWHLRAWPWMPKRIKFYNVTFYTWWRFFVAVNFDPESR